MLSIKKILKKSGITVLDLFYAAVVAGRRVELLTYGL